MSGSSSDKKIDFPVPEHVAATMEDRRGRVEGTIDEKGDYHDTFEGNPVVGTLDKKTQGFKYSWEV